jgi:hypothetical protein
LRNEIAKELDRSRRKLEFLSTRDAELNAGNIEKLQGQRDAFRRVLTIMTYLEQPESSILGSELSHVGDSENFAG